MSRRSLARLTLATVLPLAAGLGCKSVDRRESDYTRSGDVQATDDQGGFLGVLFDMCQQAYFPPTEPRGDRMAYPWEG